MLKSRSNSKLLAFAISLMFFAQLSMAQNASPAIAYPVDNITIDGSLEDWPTDLPRYPISFIFADSIVDKSDFTPSFSVGYNLLDKSLYLGVEIIDDSHVAIENPEDYGLIDCVLLYLDVLHSPKGGANMIFTAGEKYRDVFKRTKFQDPNNHGINWEDVELEIKRHGDTTVYEWKIFLGDALKPNKPIGLDYYIIDADEGQEESISALWTEGFGKSLGALHLGNVIPIATDAKMGWLEGSIDVKDTLINPQINSLKVTSTDNPDFWAQVVADSTGKYKAYLPAGEYTISPLLNISSYVYSSDFHLDSKRVAAEQPITTSIKHNSTSQAPPLELNTIPPVSGLFAKEGILLNDGFSEQKMDRFIKTYQEYFGIPGVSIALIKDGKVVYDKFSGLKNTVTDEPLNQQTLFEAASITKSVFAVIVLKLVEKNIIDLDKPLYQYLRFPNIEKDDRSKLLTARMVLNHQSGLQNWPFPSKFGGPGGWQGGKEITLDFEPGTDYFYSGAAFNYLGRVVEQITGKTLSELFKEEVAGPFGLKNSYFTYNDSLQNNITFGHYHSFPHFKEKVNIDSPASSLMTEANDFKKFVLGLMNEEHLSKEWYKTIYEPYTVLKQDEKLYDPDLPQGVSYGFFVQDTPQGKIVGHGGNNGDFDCKYSYMPDKKVGYVAFTNSNLGDEFIRLLELYVFRGNGE